MAINCIPQALANAFYVYGKFVGRHPLPFMIVPPIIAVGLLIGLIRMDSTSDPEYLYVPVDAPSKEERQFFQDTFHHNDDRYFTPLRSTELDGNLRIHIQNKHGNNILNDDVIAAIFALDDYVLNFKIKYKGNRYKYENLCAKWDGDCTYNAFITIVSNNSVSDLDLIYPFHTTGNGQTFSLVQQLGGVELNSSDVVQSARSVLLSYHVKYQDPGDVEKSTAWLNSLRDKLFNYKDTRIEIDFETSLSLEQELEGSVASIVPLFALTYNVLSLFAVLSCMMFDWVRSKPWVAISGVVSAGLGAVSSMGLMSAAGVKFASVVGTMPFLIIGIGLDDMFILVSAWRFTSFKLRTEERVGQMLKSAAVSITITSVTDALAFGIGCLTPFRSVTIFCAYTGVAVVFVYVYMITFTTACMTYSGRREEANRHCFACKKVLPRSQAGHKSQRYQICCASGSTDEEANARVEIITVEKKHPLPPIGSEIAAPPEDPLLEQGIQLPYLNVFLGTTYANFITKAPVKAAIVLVYAALISGAIYGILVMEEGLDRANLAPDDSYFRGFFRKYQRDYSENYGPVVMVAIDESLNYTRQSVRDDIDDLIRKFRNDKYFVKKESFVISWLDRYVSYLGATGRDIGAMDMGQFITILQDEFFLIDGYKHHLADVIISNDNASIKQSRIFVQSESLGDSTAEKNMMINARQIAEKSKFDAVVFSPPFIFFDQFTVILQNTLQNLGIAVGSMMVVSLILIPSLITAVWVTLATVSICSCIMGYMSLWGVSLDSVSMINLVMCIGFSVDFAAHISYHFVVSMSKDPNQRARDALGYLGTPIIQGALSTVIAVLALATSNTYIFRTFFKLVFLVMVFGFYHAMCLLPVLLSTLNCDRCKKQADVSDSKEGTPVKTQSSLEGKENKAFENSKN